MTIAAIALLSVLSGYGAHAGGCDKVQIEAGHAYQFISLGDGSSAFHGTPDEQFLQELMGRGGNPVVAEATGPNQFSFVAYEVTITALLGQKLGVVAELALKPTALGCRIEYKRGSEAPVQYRVISRNTYGDYVLAKSASTEAAMVIRKLARTYP